MYPAASGRAFDSNTIILIVQCCRVAAISDIAGTRPARRDGGL